MTELDRIVDQIVKYLLDFAEISSDKQLLTGENQVEADMFVGADSSKVRSVVLIVWLISKSVTSSITP